MSTTLKLGHPVVVPAATPYITIQHGVGAIPDVLTLDVVSHTSTAAPTFTQVFADSRSVTWQWTNPEADTTATVQASATVTEDPSYGVQVGAAILSTTFAVTPSGGGGASVTTGTISFADGVTTHTVAFNVAQPDTAYQITLGFGITGTFAEQVVTGHWENKTVNGFDIVLDNAPLGDPTLRVWVDWIVAR